LRYCRAATIIRAPRPLKSHPDCRRLPIQIVAPQSFFSSLKTERIRRKVYRTRDAARADIFDYIERFYNATRRHSTIGYVSPVEFERKVGLA
jgi:transposase InsO family protein